MRPILCLLLAACSTMLFGISITDRFNQETELSLEELSSVPRDTIETVRSKDGVVQSDLWEGFRFDIWLRDKGFTDFTGIRFSSADRFQVSLEKAHWDSLECWMMFARNGVPFENSSPRIVFPALRDLYWVRDLDKVFLEDIVPLGLPTRFVPMDAFLAKFPLRQDPEPFKNMQGWQLSELFADVEIPPQLEILFVSRDMMKTKLLWEKHLQGAILEARDGAYNLKSPAIPGGMWLKDIVYIQLGNHAWLREGSIGLFPDLDTLLKWNIAPGSLAVLHAGKIHMYLKINELMEASTLLAEQDWFELFQP